MGKALCGRLSLAFCGVIFTFKHFRPSVLVGVIHIPSFCHPLFVDLRKRVNRWRYKNFYVALKVQDCNLRVFRLPEVDSINLLRFAICCAGV